MDFGLKGRTVLVTGASRNMGRYTALAFAKEGANLAICTSTQMTHLDAVADEARKLGVEVFAAKCDVTNPDNVNEFVTRAATKLGSVDVVVNVAGFRAEAPFLEESIENWNRTIAVNLTGPFHVCRAAIPYMMKRKWGRIISFAGVAPYVGGPAAKAMVKLGTVGMMRGLAREFGPYGITANCVGPGSIARESDTAETAKPMTPSVRLGRHGTADECVSAVIYLASEQAGYITGQSYLVNGGAYFS